MLQAGAGSWRKPWSSRPARRQEPDDTDQLEGRAGGRRECTRAPSTAMLKADPSHSSVRGASAVLRPFAFASPT